MDLFLWIIFARCLFHFLSFIPFVFLFQRPRFCQYEKLIRFDVILFDRTKQKNSSELIYFSVSDRTAFRYLSSRYYVFRFVIKTITNDINFSQGFHREEYQFPLKRDKDKVLCNINYSLCRFTHKKQYYKRYNLDTVLHSLLRISGQSRDVSFLTKRVNKSSLSHCVFVILFRYKRILEIFVQLADVITAGMNAELYSCIELAFINKLRKSFYFI